MSVVGGVKGTKNGLSLEVPTPIRNVYKRHRFFLCVFFFGWGERNLKLLGLSLNVPPPVR